MWSNEEKACLSLANLKGVSKIVKQYLIKGYFVYLIHLNILPWEWRSDSLWQMWVQKGLKQLRVFVSSISTCPSLSWCIFMSSQKRDTWGAPIAAQFNHHYSMGREWESARLTVCTPMKTLPNPCIDKRLSVSQDLGLGGVLFIPPFVCRSLCMTPSWFTPGLQSVAWGW